MMRRLLLTTTVAFVVLLLPAATRAAQGESLTLSPARVELKLDPGQTTSGQIEAIDDGTDSYTFNVNAEDFSIKNEDYDIAFKLPENALDAGRWFLFPRTQFHLNPNDRVMVPYTVSVPANATPGGHYAVVFATTKPDTPTGGAAGIATQKRAGVLFYITVGGAISNQGRVASWDVNRWQINPPLSVAVRLENTGNNHFPATVHTTVTDLLGNQKAKMETQVLVLPQTVRKVQLKWGGAPSLGLFKVSGTVDYLGKSEPLKGKYVLMMTVQFFLIMSSLIIIIITSYIWTRRREKRGRSKRKR